MPNSSASARADALQSPATSAPRIRASHPAETPDDEDRLAGVRPGRVQPPEISVDVE
jgi:hypothetical protein